MRVLIAVDSSLGAKRAVKSVASRPWPAGSVFRVLSVFQIALPSNAARGGIPQSFRRAYTAAMTRPAETAVSMASATLGRSGLTADTKVVEGHPGKAIVAEATRWKADLIVLGSRGLSKGLRMLLGSVAAYVSANADCSVEIVRSRKR
jgi:nucleotide-binding universal stress UspA family protein